MEVSHSNSAIDTLPAYIGKPARITALISELVAGCVRGPSKGASSAAAIVVVTMSGRIYGGKNCSKKRVYGISRAPATGWTVFIRADAGAHVKARSRPSSLLRPRSVRWLGASPVPDATEANKDTIKHGICFFFRFSFFHSGSVNARRECWAGGQPQKRCVTISYTSRGINKTQIT